MERGLRGLNRNVQKAENGVASAISDMKRDTEDMTAETTAGRKRKETKEMAVWNVGQKNMELFKKLIAANTWEQENRARPEKGKMRGLTAYEWTFFETNAENKPIDVRDVFKSWLNTRTQSATGGTPDDPRDDVAVTSPNWGTRVSSAVFWSRKTLSNRRIIDDTDKVFPKGKAVPEYLEWQKAYQTAMAEWNLENNPKATSTPSRAEVIAAAPPTTPAQPQPPAPTELGQPLTVPISPSLAVVRKRMASILNDPRTKKPWVFGARFNNPDDGIVYIFDGVEWQEK
jgi:hypothetical protein